VTVAVNDRGGGRPVLLLHGVGGTSLVWTRTQEALTAAGFRSLAWDMPGYGHSPPLPAPSFAAWADAMIGVLDARGIDAADIVGYSLGGMVAIEAALRHPARIRRLVLTGTSDRFSGRDPAWTARYVADRLVPLEAGMSMPQVAARSIPDLLGDDPDDEAGPTATQAMAAIPKDVYRATMLQMTSFDRAADLPAIAHRTLLIAGGRDTLVGPSVMGRMARAMPQARFVELPTAGHLSFLEQPAAFQAHLLAFLSAP